jgi:decaprenylphospho-beta-D-erythro-pentofuranosid-2-ulose 2-reductase
MTAHMDDAPMAVTPPDVAASIVQGIAKGSETVWVPGKLRWVMFVLRHLPRFIFRRLKI